ncbi:ribbon-helix-helix domain-containing protein [Nostoc sp.]|uniref:ribbon-helix-helix domain-containing protein n=1 Tax=Nostoc sp. TaxID=1180 RepID=UPI002FFAF30D
MHRRINITLPDETIELIDQVIEKGDSPEERLRQRSRFINEAVQYYIAQKSLANLREQLKEGAIQRAERDLGLVEEWFDLEEELWHRNEK